MEGTRPRDAHIILCLWRNQPVTSKMVNKSVDLLTSKFNQHQPTGEIILNKLFKLSFTFEKCQMNKIEAQANEDA
jgi:hypothetical protein